MATFGLVKSFGIDHGELDGFSAQQCFVLGYELAEIDHLLRGVDPIERPVHAANRERIAASCKETGRGWELMWLPGDLSESWLLLRVAPRDRE